MTNNTQVVQIDTLRSIAFGSISGTYAAIGTAFTEPVRLICFTNTTDGDMFLSDDGVNNKMFIPKGAFKLFDLTSNKFSATSFWVLPIGTQFYVKQSTAPTLGAVYIECLWGQ